MDFATSCKPAVVVTSLPAKELKVEKDSVFVLHPNKIGIDINSKFSQQQRIKKRGDFLTLKHSGKKKVTPFLIFYFLENELEYSRLGITVTKKVGNSPYRNYIRRVIREWFRLNITSKNLNLDISIIVKNSYTKKQNTLTENLKMVEKILYV